MKIHNSRIFKTLLSVVLVVAALSVVVSSAYALNSFFKTWQDTYPHSTSDNADCATCHGSSTNNLNAYGRDLCLSFGGTIPADITPYLRVIESENSDLDAGVFSNLDEIDAGAQPGWTTGLNPLYGMVDAGCAPLGTSIEVPAGVPLPYDPPTYGDPIAIPGGPYAGYINIAITFDGSASYDSDGGAIASYTWDFGDGTTGTGPVVQHVYTTAATYTVSLTVVDDEGASNTNSTTATVSGGAVLDLDIAAFKPSGSVRLGKTVTIQLTVENPGTVLGQALATVVGMKDGVQVYSWALNVYDYNGKGSTSFTFPSYTPTSKGTINWTATIADVDPDIDQALANTIVK